MTTMMLMTTNMMARTKTQNVHLCSTGRRRRRRGKCSAVVEVDLPSSSVYRVVKSDRRTDREREREREKKETEKTWEGCRW